jgi:hypothetical protein
MLNKTRTLTALGTSLFLALASAGYAAADERVIVREKNPREQRDGLAIGVELGGGHMQCDADVGCDGVTEAAGLSLNVGAMLSPNLAIMADGWMMGHTEDRLTLTHGMATIGPQLWIGPFWVRGGLGVARASFNYDAGLVDIGDKTETVPAAMAALGVEVLATKDFALDVRLRGGTGYFRDGDVKVHNVSLGVGANWY